MTNLQPYWSVMIPTFNPSEQFLEEALCSVLQQDPGPSLMQIVLVDDGSRSGPPAKLVQKLAGERVQIHREPANVGLAHIWNRCIKLAQGQWIHILHQDDFVLPGFYDTLRTALEQHPYAGAAFTRNGYCDQDGQVTREAAREEEQAGLLPHALERVAVENKIVCASIVVRKTAYEQVGGYNPALTHALDWDMWIRLAAHYPIYYHPHLLACWREHKSATTSAQIRTGENIRDLARVINNFAFIMDRDLGRRLAFLARRRYSEIVLEFARHFLSIDELEACLSQLRAGEALRPGPRWLAEAALVAFKAKSKPLRRQVGLARRRTAQPM